MEENVMNFIQCIGAGIGFGLGFAIVMGIEELLH